MAEEILGAAIAVPDGINNLKNNRMRALLITIASIAVIAYLMEVKIQFQPLKVEFRNISNGIAWILLVLSILVHTYSVHKKAYRKGIDDTIQKLVELTEKETDNEIK